MKKIDNLSDVNTNDYNKSLNICKDIIKEIYNVDYKEYHNIGIKSYNKTYIECRNIYVYTSCYIMGVPLDILCELENINRSEVTKIINSINNRKSYDDRQLFCKIINYIQS